jgi:hypothetical protein
MVLTTLLYSRALAHVLSCVFFFGATAPFAYIQSGTLRSERKGALAIWLIWLDLLVWFGAASSRSARVSLRNASFYIAWQREEDMVSFHRSDGRDDSSFGRRIRSGSCSKMTQGTLSKAHPKAYLCSPSSTRPDLAEEKTCCD